jgi:hypothetical protein
MMVKAIAGHSADRIKLTNDLARLMKLLESEAIRRVKG